MTIEKLIEYLEKLLPMVPDSTEVMIATCSDGITGVKLDDSAENDIILLV